MHLITERRNSPKSQRAQFCLSLNTNVPKIQFSRKCYFFLLCGITIRQGYHRLWIETPSALVEASNLDRNHVNHRLRGWIIEQVDGDVWWMLLRTCWGSDRHPVNFGGKEAISRAKASLKLFPALRVLNSRRVVYSIWKEKTDALRGHIHSSNISSW